MSAAYFRRWASRGKGETLNNKAISKFEFFAFIVLILFGILWMLNPEGNIEPFFAFVSSCLIGAELLRRGVIRIPLLTTKSNTEYISPLSLADNEFEFIEKISSFQLTDDIYHPENNNETEICTSLTNQGLFIKKGNEFHLTEKGTMLIVDIGKNS